MASRGTWTLLVLAGRQCPPRRLTASPYSPGQGVGPSHRIAITAQSRLRAPCVARTDRKVWPPARCPHQGEVDEPLWAQDPGHPGGGARALADATQSFNAAPCPRTEAFVEVSASLACVATNPHRSNSHRRAGKSKAVHHPHDASTCAHISTCKSHGQRGCSHNLCVCPR